MRVAHFDCFSGISGDMVLGAVLDAGVPAPLGLVQADGWSVRRLGRHHQVLAVGYELTGDDALVACYDPNHPGDDGLTLTLGLTGGPVRGSHAGPALRGAFLTSYRRADPKVF